MLQEGPARWGDANPRCRPSLRRVHANQDPGVRLNITPPPVTSSTLSGEEVAHMVDRAVSASLANRLQKIIDGSIDNRLESSLDSKVRSAMLCVNDETAKKQMEFVEPNATPIKPSFFYNNY
jgi:hypothetical protein